MRQAEQSPDWIANAERISPSPLPRQSAHEGMDHLLARYPAGNLESAWLAYEGATVPLSSSRYRRVLTAIRHRFTMPVVVLMGKNGMGVNEPASHVAGVLNGGQNVLPTMVRNRTLFCARGVERNQHLSGGASAPASMCFLFGSETARLSPVAIDIARTYRMVIVWADKQDICARRRTRCW